MKKVLFTILLLANTGFTHAQSGYLLQDSMTNSPDPGRYFINYLKGETNWNTSDSDEADSKHADTRSLNFWRDRMPAGSNLDSPLYKYNYMLRNYSRSSCDPAPGDFNGNWINTGPITDNQAQAMVLDFYVDPTNNQNIFIGVENAGLWKTDNGGTSWSCLSDGFPMPGGAGVPCIAANPFNTQEIYVGTKVVGGDIRNLQSWAYGQGIWRSGDFGATWAIETAGVTDFQGMDNMQFCPYKVNGGTQTMIIGTDFGRIWQKIGTASWVDITPPGIPDLLIRDITFTTDVYGRFYLSTQHNWIGGIYTPPRIYECIYNTVGAVTSFTVIKEGTNAAAGFTFFGPMNCQGIGFETAYAENDILYMIVAALPPTPMIGSCDDAFQSIYSYNITTGIWTFEHAMPNNMTNKGMWCMGIDVSPANPDVLYLSQSQPSRLWHDLTGWHETILAPYNAFNFHADSRVVKIYASDPGTSPPGTNDVVYWGNDGGLSKTTLVNTLTNLNGQNFWTSDVYDIDVSPIKRKRVAASMHNSIYGTNSSNGWDNIADVGDGFSAIYDKRFDLNLARVMYTYGPWQPFEHNNTN